MLYEYYNYCLPLDKCPNTITHNNICWNIKLLHMMLIDIAVLVSHTKKSTLNLTAEQIDLSISHFKYYHESLVQF